MTSGQEFHRRLIEWSVPPPLDRQLATLTVRNTRNDPESCNVVLSANFGSSRLLLEVGETLLEVDCRIKKAEIRLFAANARLDYGADFAKYKHQPHVQVDRARTTISGTSVEGEANASFSGLGPAGAIAAKAKAAAAAEDSLALASSEVKYPFNHIDFHTVSVVGLPGQEYLNGSEIVEYEGWRGKFETPDKKVGVAASILVREQWIEFDNPVLKGSGPLSTALSNIFSSRASRKAKQFEVLLAFLVRKSLQDPCEKRFATLACSAFVLEPGTEQVAILQRADELEKIVIHPALVEQYEALPAGTHEEFVKSVLLADAPADKVFTASNVGTPNKISAPMASAFDAISALERLKLASESSPETIVSLIDGVPRNVRRDLSALGFLSVRRGQHANSFSNFQGSARSALLFAVSEKEWFAYTASILEREGLRFAAYRVGFEVSEEFGLEWGESSQRRYGHNMKRWVAILHPSFADLTREHVDYWYVRSLKAQAGEKGAIPIIDDDLAEEIEFRKLLGRSYKAIAEEVGISAGSYGNWKAKNPESAKAALLSARGRFESNQD